MVEKPWWVENDTKLRECLGPPGGGGGGGSEPSEPRGGGGGASGRHAAVKGMGKAQGALGNQKCANSIGAASSQAALAALERAEIVYATLGDPTIDRESRTVLYTMATTDNGTIYLNSSGYTFDNPANAVGVSPTSPVFESLNLLSYHEDSFGLPAGSLTAELLQAIYLVHELGHILNGIPGDKNDPAQSMRNTAKVMRDCFNLTATAPSEKQ